MDPAARAARIAEIRRQIDELRAELIRLARETAADVAGLSGEERDAFIGLQPITESAKVMSNMVDAHRIALSASRVKRLKRDKARTHVLPISQLGLMEMTRQRAQESLSDTIYENCPYCGGRGVVKTTMSTSVELHRTLNTVMRRYQDSIHDIRVILNPDVLKRLKEEDEELLVELERRYAGRLMFRGDPAFHHEKFVITDANTGAELKA